MSRMITGIVCVAVLTTLASCSVGPGTPLFEAVKSPRGDVNSNVQPPKGYGSPISNKESQGLINPEDRKATKDYLESFSNR
ncbi:MAG: hypothetical protein ABJN98_12515 [Roseibium sp.]